MKKKIQKTLLSIFLAASSLQATSNFNVGAYYENWAYWRSPKASGTMPGSPQPSGFLTPNPSSIPSSINILNYAFALFNWNHVPWNACLNDSTYSQYVADWNITWSDPVDDPTWTSQLASLKNSNPNLKMMLSVGGWGFCQNSTAIVPNPYAPDCSISYAYGKYTYQFFSQMVANSTYQQKFIDSLLGSNGGQTYTIASGSQSGQTQTAVVWLKSQDGCSYAFDGIDIDWEYPGQVSASDYDNFITFIKELRTAVDTLNALQKRPPVYISVTLPPFIPDNVLSGSWTAGSYPTGITGPDGNSNYAGGTINPSNPSTYFAWMSVVGNCCDWVNLMAYDMYGAFDPPSSGTQFQAPLYNGNFTSTYTPSQSDATTVPSQTSNQGYSIAYATWMWTKGALYGGDATTGLGVPPAKILLGLPAYGRSFQNSSPFSTTNPIGQPFTAAGNGQPFTQNPGTLAYYELLPLQASSAYLQYFTTSGSQITGIGNDITDKAQSWLVQNNSGGTNTLYVYDSIADIQTKVKFAQSPPYGIGALGGVFLYPITQDNIPGNKSSYDFTNSLLKKGIIDVLTPKGNQSNVNYSNRSPKN